MHLGGQDPLRAQSYPTINNGVTISSGVPSTCLPYGYTDLYSVVIHDDRCQDFDLNVSRLLNVT